MKSSLAITGTVLAVLAVIGMTLLVPQLTFSSAGFLIGMLAALLPLIIHLINRKQARIHKFAAMDFLFKVDRRIARNLKFRHLILLLVRTVLIACIPLALSKPLYQGALSDEGPLAAVLLVDNGSGMGFKAKGKTLFQRARDRAREVLESLNQSSPAALHLAVELRPFRPSLRLSFNRGALRADLARSTLSFKPSALPDAVGRAVTAIARSRQKVRRLYIFTDMAQASWEGVKKALKAAPPGLEVRLIDVAKGLDLANHAVMKVAVEQVEEGGEEYRVRAVLANYGPRPLRKLGVSLEIEGQAAVRGFVDLPAQGRITKDFFVKLESRRPARGRISLEPDNLAGDDVFHFVLLPATRPRVLLINGDPNPVPHLGEVFYLERALDPKRSRLAGVRVDIMSARKLKPSAFEGYAAVFLCNVRQLPAGRLAELHEFVRRGNGLIITAGDNVTPAYYNRAFSGLLPRKLRSLHVDISSKPGHRGLSIAPPARNHPVTAIFSAQSEEGLTAASVWKYFLLQPDISRKLSTILTLENGAPLLLERQVGTGRVLLLTTTVDRAWTDLPIQTAFLPLVHRLINHSVFSLPRHRSQSLQVGEAFRMDLPEGRGLSFRIRKPDGIVFRFDSKDLTGSKALIYGDTDLPGTYSLFREQSGLKAERAHGLFSVNLSRRISDRRRLDIRELNRRAAVNQAPGKGRPAFIKASFKRVALWPFLSIALLLFMLFEALLTRRS